MSRRECFWLVVVVGVWLTLLATMGDPAFGRDATTAESKALRDAAAVLHHVGLEPATFNVVVDDSLPYAASGGGTVYLTEQAAADARVYARATSKPTRKARQRAFEVCYFRCRDALHAAIHENIHEIRFRVMGSLTDFIVEEGLAESVTYDLFCPAVYRVTGLRGCVPELSSDENYQNAANKIRAEAAYVTGTRWDSSQARRWRWWRIGLPT